MTDLVIVSMNEKGFPQADVYCGHGETDAADFNNMGLSPDGFFTLSIGDTLEAAFERSKTEYPGATIVYGEGDDDWAEEDAETNQ